VALLLILLPCGRLFYRSSSLIDERFTPGWIVVIVLVVGASIWLGFFSYQHVEYRNELWWQFSIRHGDAPRFLRASVGAIVIIFLFGMMRMLRPARQARSGDKVAPAALTALISRFPYTYANLAFLGDKIILPSPAGGGFLMYGIEGRSWVCMGDPVCDPGERMGLIWQFRELCDRHDAWSVFYEVRQEALPDYVSVGLALYKIGEEARVPLSAFNLEGHDRKPLRKVRRQVEKQGCRFEVLPAGTAAGRLAEFGRISDEWLNAKKTREKGFSLGHFDEPYLARFPMAVVFREDVPVAFANLWLGGGFEELSPDLMRYSAAAPDDIMEYLFISLMFWGAQQGYRWFSLGMAPLSGLESHPLAPLWNRLGSLLFQHGEHFYNFQGLRNYKEKFQPVWEPRFLACPAGAAITRILLNIAALTSGGMRGVLTR
jgi:phosphatidylglycerol lysyltransferase